MTKFESDQIWLAIRCEPNVSRTLSEELLAFANACEKIGMEKAAKICRDLSKEKQKYMLFHESNGADDCEEAIRKAIE